MKPQNDPKPNRPMIGCLVAALLAMFGLAIALTANSYYAAQCEQNADCANGETEVWTITPETNGAYYATHHTPDANYLSPDTWVALGTWALVAVTLALAIFTLLLWIDSRNANRETLRNLRESHERELRAYINVYKSYVFEFSANSHPKVVIKMRNFGRTPAFNVVCALHTGLRDGSEGEDRYVATFSADDSRSVVGPGTRLISELRSTDAIPEIIVPLLMKGSATFCVFGEVRYDDAFGVGRVTKFRYRVDKGDLSLMRTWQHPDRIALVASAKGNEAT